MQRAKQRLKIEGLHLDQALQPGQLLLDSCDSAGSESVVATKIFGSFLQSFSG